jgi:hypothetical protein
MARPKLKPGEKGNYNKSRKQLELEKIKRSERAALKKKKKAQNDSNKANVQLQRSKKAKKLLTEGGITTSEFVDTLPTSIKDVIVEGEHELIFSPNKGPQTDFLAAPEKEVLYGGAAGGGKSYALLVDPLRYADNPNHRALLLRRTLGELAELIDQSKKVYPKAFVNAILMQQDFKVNPLHGLV